MVDLITESRSLSATRRCLVVNEILERIVRELLPETGHVLAFSRTCRAFLELGLDVLWSHLDGLDPVDYVLENKSSDELSRCDPEEIGRVPTSDVWSRLYGYTKRVRSIEAASGSVETDMLQFWSINKPYRFIFPNLQKLIWEQFSGDGDAVYGPLFVSPKLKEVSVTLASCVPNKVAIQWLDSLRIIATDLREFKFDNSAQSSTRTCIDALSSAIFSWERLTRLSLCDSQGSIPLGPMQLNYLARLDSLKTLEVALDPKILPESLSSEQSFFPALESLKLEARNIDSLAVVKSIIHQVQSPNLFSLHITTTEQPTVLDICAVIEVVKLRKQLREFTMELSDSAVKRDSSDPFVLSNKTLEPLLTLKSLRKVVIATYPVEITTEFLEKMGDSWPELGELVLGVDPPCELIDRPLSRLRLTELEPFIEKYPKLHTLGLLMALDLPAVSDLPKRRILSRQNLSHFQLYVGHPARMEEIENPYPLAAYLSGVFGDVKVMYDFDCKIPKLRKALDLFSSVRTQERTNAPES
ncbi:hypothetical protein QCA50_010407 [Cerrena zonata]|uniref:F-box domain-containing protein n=1 Tax=Cerrena zonata TaxID=2478898 RepID=A0AAW0FFB4_9APHY